MVVLGDGEEGESLRVGLEEDGGDEALGLPERALVEEVVAHPDIGHWCLGGDGLDGRVRADASQCREQSGIGRAEHTDLAVVAGEVLHEPVDGVVRVGRFVGGVRVVRVARRAHEDEVAAGTETPTDVLAHEDVAVLSEFAVRAGYGGVPEGVGGGERGADEEDGEGLSDVRRDECDGEEGGAVANGDGELAPLVGGRLLRGGGGDSKCEGRGGEGRVQEATQSSHAGSPAG